MFLFSIIISALIFIGNLPVLWRLWKKEEPTTINKLIFIDCLLALLMIPLALRLGKVIQLPCNFGPFYGYCVTLINRLIPVAIVMYRYVYVCKPSWVTTKKQRNHFDCIIMLFLGSLTFLSTFFSLVYRKSYLIYLFCIGEISKDEYRRGRFLQGPFIFLYLFSLFLFVIVVPLGYIQIFLFRKNDNLATKTLNETARFNRKHRNILTTKFNLFSWLFEFFGTIFLLTHGPNILFIITCSLSPINFYVGTKMKVLDRKKRVVAILRHCVNAGNALKSYQYISFPAFRNCCFC